MSLLNQQSSKLPVPVPPSDFPAWLHHPEKPSIMVRSAEEAERFEADGYSPKMVAKAEAPTPLTLEEQLAAARMELASQKQTFDEAWTKLLAENDGLKAENAKLKKAAAKKEAKPEPAA